MQMIPKGALHSLCKCSSRLSQGQVSCRGPACDQRAEETAAPFQPRSLGLCYTPKARFELSAYSTRGPKAQPVMLF